MTQTKTRRVFTCTPVRFKGDRTFFARDSGLLSEGLRMNGVESRAVMPGPPMGDDDPDLIRATPTELQSADWWRAHELDAAVFFSWGVPAYTRIAEAIKSSGTKLVIVLDSSGLWSPWSNGNDWFRVQWNTCIRKRSLATGPLLFMGYFLRSCFPRSFDHPRLQQMNLADVVTVSSPRVLGRTKRYATVYGYAALAERVHFLPLPVSPQMRYEQQQKQKRVISIGRWLREDWPQKQPRLLLQSLCAFLECRPDFSAVIVGRGATGLRKEKFFPKSAVSERISLRDFVPNSELAPLLATSRISICSSFHESFHIASFEAACCGCSVVALQSPDLPALEMLAPDSGTLAVAETPEAFRDALCHEAELWDRAARNPGVISGHWQKETHAPNVASRLMRAIGFWACADRQ